MRGAQNLLRGTNVLVSVPAAKLVGRLIVAIGESRNSVLTVFRMRKRLEAITARLLSKSVKLFFHVFFDLVWSKNSNGLKWRGLGFCTGSVFEWALRPRDSTYNLAFTKSNTPRYAGGV